MSTSREEQSRNGVADQVDGPKPTNGQLEQDSPDQATANAEVGQEGVEQEEGKGGQESPDQATEKPAAPAYRIEKDADRIVVHAPYNGTFVELARAYGGKYDVDQRTWSFPAEKKKLVEQMCAFAYEGKGPKAKRAKASLTKALTGQMVSTLPVTLKFGVMAFAFGMKGVRGMQVAQYLFSLVAGSRDDKHPVPRPLRARGGGHGYAPMNMGGQELFLERSGIGIQR